MSTRSIPHRTGSSDLQNIYGTALVSYGYAAWHVRERNADTFVFDKINRLREATASSKGADTYRYDGWGRRWSSRGGWRAALPGVWPGGHSCMRSTASTRRRPITCSWEPVCSRARNRNPRRAGSAVLTVLPSSLPKRRASTTISWTSMPEAVRYVLKERTNGVAPVEMFNGSGNAQPVGGKPTGTYVLGTGVRRYRHHYVQHPSANADGSVIINPLCVPSAPVDNPTSTPTQTGRTRSHGPPRR